MEGQLNLINPGNLIQYIFTCIVKSRGIHKKVETKFIITIETLDKIQNGINQRNPRDCWEKNLQELDLYRTTQKTLNMGSNREILKKSKQNFICIDSR